MTPVGAARHRQLAYLAWIAVCVIWGTTYLAIRVALETVPVALLAGFRWLAAGLILGTALAITQRPFPAVRMWGSIAVLSLLMQGLGNGMVVWAQQHVASGLTAVIIAMAPFWSVLVESFAARGERVSIRGALGLLVGFCGIVILVWPEATLSGGNSQMFLAGVVALQIACLGWALGTSYTKRHTMLGDPLTTSAVQMVFSGLMFMAVATATGEWTRLSFNARTTTAMLYLAIAGSAVAYSAFVYALKYLPISTVSLYAYVNPVIAVVLGTIVLDEPFSPRIVAAAVLVFGGIAIVRSQGLSRKTPVEPSARVQTSSYREPQSVDRLARGR